MHTPSHYIIFDIFRKLTSVTSSAKLTLLTSPTCCPLHQPELLLTLSLYVPLVSHTHCLSEQRFCRTDCAVHVSLIPSRCCSRCLDSSVCQQYHLYKHQCILHCLTHPLSRKYLRKWPSMLRLKGQTRREKVPATTQNTPSDCAILAPAFQTSVKLLTDARRLVTNWYDWYPIWYPLANRYVFSQGGGGGYRLRLRALISVPQGQNFPYILPPVPAPSAVLYFLLRNDKILWFPYIDFLKFTPTPHMTPHWFQKFLATCC